MEQNQELHIQCDCHGRQMMELPSKALSNQ